MSIIKGIRQETIQLLVTLLIAGFTIVVTISPPNFIISLSNRLSDTYYSINPHSPDSRVVFASVDHASVKRIGRWPWNRKKIADAFKHLAQADVVALDIIFADPSENPDDDLYLAETLAEMNTITGFLFNGPLAHKLTEDEESDLMGSALIEVKGSHLPFVQSDIVELNIPEIRQNSVLTGTLNTLPDPDELFRRYPIAYVSQGSVLPTLGVQSIRLLLNKDVYINAEEGKTEVHIDQRSIDIDDRGFTRINFYPEKSYQVISFADIVNGKYSDEFFAKKVVIVGITEAGITDIRATPLGQFPGPLMHYTFISNFLGDHLLENKRWLILVLTTVAALIPLLLIRTCSTLALRVTITLFLMLLIHISGMLLYRHANLWVESFYPIIALILSTLYNEYGNFRQQENQSQFLRDAFNSYVSPALLDQISSQQVQLELGGTSRRATYLFTDIRNFSTHSENMNSTKLVEMINALFTPLTEEILNHQGTLDKYIGDAIVAIFNAPIEFEDHEYEACCAALGMMQRLQQFNQNQQLAGGPILDIGIGINTGEAHIGNMGSSFRFNYTAMGDSVNLASRLEGLNKTYQTHIIIGEQTWLAVKDRLQGQYIDTVTVKGKSQPENVYELFVGQEPIAI